MTARATEKIIDALTLLMEGYAELQAAVEADYNPEQQEETEDSSSEASLEIDAAIVSEIKVTLESVIDTEDYSPEEVASLVSTMTDALEEIDPDVFEENEEESIYDDDDIDYGEDDDYLDDDDIYDEYDDELDDDD